MVAADGPADGLIQPWNEHPWYWAYNDEPIVLLGATDTDSLFQWAQSPERLDTQLERLAAAGGNFVRNTMNSRRAGDAYPFARQADGRYDLTAWNETYWELFDTFLAATAARDIIVQIELWDGHNYQSRSDDPDGFDQWDADPYNPQNNATYTAEATTLPTTYTRGYHDETHPMFLTIPALHDDQTVLAVQERFVERVLEYAFGYPNVLFTIQNESWAPQAWSDYWRAFIHEYAAAQGRDHVYVSDMRRYGPKVTPVLEHGFDYAEISQSGGLAGQEHFDGIAAALDDLTDTPVPVNSVKQYGSDEIAWTDGTEEGLRRLWRTVFAGQAAVRNHRPPFGIGQSPRALAHIASLRAVTDCFQLARVEPHHTARELLRDRDTDECYLLAERGRRHALYFPGPGRVEIDLSGFDDGGSLRWLNADTARWETECQSVPTDADGWARITAEDRGHQVALLCVERVELASPP